MALTITEAFVQRIHEAAKAADIHIIQSLPDIDTPSRAPKVDLEQDTFCDAITALKPAVLYWEDVQLDLDEAVRTRLEIGLDKSDPVDIAEHPALIAFLSTWRKQDHKTNTAIGCFAIEGVLHVCVVNEDWPEILELRLDEVYFEMADLLDAREPDRRRIDPETHARATQLADHVAFNAPKASKDKRTYLAETIFPDVRPYDLERIVDRATNIAWLRDATVDEDD